MKKVISIVGSFILFLPITSVLACSNNLSNLLANLNDYDWKQEEPYFTNYQNASLSNKNIIGSGNLLYTKNQSYLNYQNFNTGFKNSDGVEKQAVTGVPMNSAFLPNGNYLKDFGETRKSLMYQPVNSILDWNPNVDHDAKYNQGDYPLLKTKKVANKWVASQDAQIQTQILGLGVEHTAAMNSVIGSNRIYSYNFNNWQYTDRFVAWAGSSSEGIIIPPAADEINAAHINGTRIYGQIFLDGYHGLNKAMLRDFLRKDESGNFKIVDILINMAKYMGFDGWFYNNEPNGSWSNGFIMDSQNSIDIIKQFNDKVQVSSDAEIKNLELIVYKDQGRLNYDQTGKPTDRWSDKLASANNGLFVPDFYYYPNDSQRWSADHSNFNSFDIHNMYNLGGWVKNEIFYNENRIGTRDLRELTQRHLNQNGQEYQSSTQEYIDRENNKWTFDGHNTNSITVFAATTPFDMSKLYLERLNHTPLISDDIYATVRANYYDDMVYTGRNRYLNNEDSGSTSWNPNFYEREENQNLSYGVGDLVQENTILFDDDKGVDNVSNFKTNFSTGQGQMFISDDDSVIKDYPWNNRRLFDTQPTYKWNIESSKDKTPISSISGFYDYYNPYRKGNSIALGSSFDTTGKILPFVLNDKINWNIMGTNYNSSNKNVTFKYKITNENDKWEAVKDAFQVNILVTFDDGSTSELTGNTSQADANGWVTISSNLAALGGGITASKIAKLGLSIAPDSKNKHSKDKIKFNVGEMTVNFKEQKTNNIKQSYITNLTSENAITRNNQTSLRLNWNVDSKLQDQVAYYELYLQKVSGATLFVGQTVDSNYYLKNLLIASGDKIVIKTVNRFNVGNSVFQSWTIKS